MLVDIFQLFKRMLFCAAMESNVFVRFQKEDTCLHPDLEFWVQLIANDNH